MWGKVDCLKRRVRRGTVLLKDKELVWDLTYGDQSSIMLRLILFTNVAFVIDNLRQVSNWCNVNHLLLADWRFHWLNDDYVRRRFITSFFSADVHTVGHSVGFSLWPLYVNMFSSVNKIMLTSYLNIWTTVLNAWVLEVRFTQLWDIAIFER